MNEKKLTWKETQNTFKSLGQQIKNDGFMPDYIIGITTGGLIPLYFLANELNIDNIATISASSYEGKEQEKLKITYLPELNLRNKKILLVDDISETGNTLKAIMEKVTEKYGVAEVRTATLAVNTEETQFYPNYYEIAEDGAWLSFPWENEE